MKIYGSEKPGESEMKRSKYIRDQSCDMDDLKKKIEHLTNAVARVYAYEIPGGIRHFQMHVASLLVVYS